MNGDIDEIIDKVSPIRHDNMMWKNACMQILKEIRYYQKSHHDDKDIWHNIHAYMEVEDLKFKLLKFFIG